MPTEAELKLTIELWDTRKQLIEAHAQIMQYQHRDADAEIAATQAMLDKLQAEKTQTE
ncbi:MAG: hypothetical protein Q7T25_06170 [Sideroxyarcus sp.]|nr:hypothetical protein [Sideroxyarcus sp.]